MKRFLLGLLLIGIVITSAWGQDPHVFLGIYWTTGEAIRGPGVPLTVVLGGRSAILYPSVCDPLDAGRRVTNSTDTSGRFVLNPFYNENIPVTFEAGFYSAAILRGADGYGADPVTFSFNPSGYNYVSLTLAYGAGPGQYILDDTGLIRNTNIERVANDLVISWGYDPVRLPTGTNVQVYAQSSTGDEFNATGGFPVFGGVIAAGTTRTIHSGAAVDGNNHFYRVVTEGTVSIVDPAANSITVGKVTVALPANKYVFTAVPFMDDLVSIQTVLGDQVGDGGEYLWWDGLSYHGGTYASGHWTGEERNLRASDGMVLRTGTIRQIALVGRFGRYTLPAVRNLIQNRYNLLAYPYPTARQFETMGITPDSGADLLRWTVDSQAYEGATYSGSWVGPAGINNLELGRPRFYRPKTSDFRWEMSFP